MRSIDRDDDDILILLPTHKLLETERVEDRRSFDISDLPDRERGEKNTKEQDTPAKLDSKSGK